MKRMLSILKLVPLAITCLLCFATTVRGQVTSIHINDLTDSMRLHPKPTLILISTSWCNYCQMQKAQLKKNKDFRAASPRFYFAELDAEAKQDIPFNGNTYRFKSTGPTTGTHDLALTLGKGDAGLSYPTWVLLDENFQLVFRYGGVIRPKKLRKLVELLKGGEAAE